MASPKEGDVRRAMFLVMVTAFTWLGMATAQTASFDGTFADQQNGVSILFQVGANGALQGTLSGPNGQFPLQGEFGQGYAYGVVQSTQGPLGFQAQLSADGNSMQIAFFTMDANNQATQQGQMVLQRMAGGVGQPPLGQPQNPLGGQPQNPLGGQPQNPLGGQPQNPLGGQPQNPLGGQPQNPFGQQPPGGNPFGAPVTPSGVDWNGTFTGDAGAFVLSVQGAQGQYVGYLLVQGQRYPFEAHVDDPATLHGAFQAGGQQYEFFADRNGPSVMLSIGQTTYLLEQTSAQATP